MSPQSKAKSSSKKESTFFDMLKQDHDMVRDLFEQIEEAEEDARPDLFMQLQSELQAHLQLEEDFFYPVLEQSEEMKEKALEAYEEHNVAKHVLKDCASIEADDERWNAKLKVLREIVNHHLQEEEKNIFKTAKSSLEKDQIQQITSQMQRQKSQMEKKAA